MFFEVRVMSSMIADNVYQHWNRQVNYQEGEKFWLKSLKAETDYKQIMAIALEKKDCEG